MTESEYLQAKNIAYLRIATDALDEITTSVMPIISDGELRKIRDTLRRWIDDALGEMSVDDSDW